MPRGSSPRALRESQIFALARLCRDLHAETEGAFDIIMSIAYRKETEIWWLQLIGGIIELALGFWAAGYYGRSAILLVAWVAAFAIIRGVRDLVAAFRVRELQHPKPAS